MIRIEKTDSTNFAIDSLNAFDRYQEVNNIYQLTDGQLQLVYHPFSDAWTLERKREKAREIMSGKFITFCAFLDSAVVGEIMLNPKLNKQRMIVTSFHVSASCRRHGIGRMLFEKAKEEAVRHHAEGLYISACSAEETIRFYQAMGCYVSPDPILELAEDEPADIQMEYHLRKA